MDIEKKFVSINFKITLMVLIAIIIVSISIGGFSIYRYYTDLIRIEGEAAANSAASLAAQIDVDQLMEIIKTKSKTSYYENLKSDIGNARAMTGYLYYVMAKEDDKYTYYATSYLPTETEDIPFMYQDDVSLFGSEPLEAFENGKLTATDVWDAGRYGMLVSGFAPIKDSDDNIIGIAGIDLNIDDVLKNFRIFSIQVFSVVIVISLISIFIVRVILKNMIIMPIKKLAEVSSKLSVGDIDLDN